MKLLCALSMLVTLGYPCEAADEPKIVFQGQPRDITFCENDDVRLSIIGGALQVECADQRKTAVTVRGNGTAVGNLSVDCRGWPALAMNVHGGNNISIKGTTMLNCGTGIALDQGSILTGDGASSTIIKAR